MSACSFPRWRAGTPDVIEYLFRRLCDQQIHCVLTFDRVLDAERLALAVRLTLDAEPVLGCRFIERPWRSYWQRRDDLDSCAPCRLEAAFSLDDQLQRFMTAPCDPRVDPLLRVFLLRSSVDTICVKVDHVVADASGLRDCVALIASIYNRLGRDPSYRPQPNLDGDRGFGQVLHQFSFRDKVAAAARLVARRKVGSWHFPATGEDRDERIIVVRHFGAERLAALRAYRLQHAATTNDVLLAAFFRALVKVIDPPRTEPLPVGFSLDLRHYLPRQRTDTICNLAGAVFPAFVPRPDEPLDATVAKVRDTMRAIESQHPGLAGAIGAEVLVKLGLPWLQGLLGLVIQSGGATNPYFSNLGGLGTRADFGGPMITDGYLVGPVMFPRGCMLAVSSSGRSLTMTVGFCQSATRRADVQRVLDLIERDLPR